MREQNQRWAAHPPARSVAYLEQIRAASASLRSAMATRAPGREGCLLRRCNWPRRWDLRSRWLLGRQPQIFDDAAKQAIVVVDRLQGAAYVFNG